MGTFCYNRDENNIYSITVTEFDEPTVLLTVEDLASFLQEQKYVSSAGCLKSAENMFTRSFLTAGKAEEDVDPMLKKAIMWKRRGMKNSPKGA
jgi:hypothetical protein